MKKTSLMLVFLSISIILCACDNRGDISSPLASSSSAYGSSDIVGNDFSDSVPYEKRSWISNDFTLENEKVYSVELPEGIQINENSGLALTNKYAVPQNMYADFILSYMEDGSLDIGGFYLFDPSEYIKTEDGYEKENGDSVTSYTYSENIENYTYYETDDYYRFTTGPGPGGDSSEVTWISKSNNVVFFIRLSSTDSEIQEFMTRIFMSVKLI